MKAIKIIHILLTVILTAAFVLLGVFVFRNSYLRLIETAKDFYKSVVYYGSTLFNVKTEIVPTVNGYSEVFSWQGYLPDSPDSVKEFFNTFFATFVDKENFNLWLNGIMSVLGVVLEIIVFALPIVIILVILIKRHTADITIIITVIPCHLKYLSLPLKYHLLPYITLFGDIWTF